MDTLETDYLVIGAGATGLAFADTMLDESDAQLTIVDRHGHPGGHWNDAYPFVTLHQPSAFYGVNSMALGSGRKDERGLNAGLYELASGAEILAYYERVVQHRLLPSGRVRYHPMSTVLGHRPGQPPDPADGPPGERVFECLLSGRRTRVVVRRKVVDATYYSPRVPSTQRPRFEVAAGVDLVPPNALPSLGLRAAPPRRFVVLGAGKTAMDAVVWLLQAGVEPAQIRWVRPRDAWLVHRATTQPAPEFFHQTIGNQAMQMQAVAEATSTEDLFARLEAGGMLLRIDPTVQPTMFHLATVSPGEVALMQRVTDVVRLGRVQALRPGRMALEQGAVDVEPGTLFVDCTASAVEPREVLPIFQGDRIVLQLVRLPQPTFSAALIAYVEAHHADEKTRQRLCGSVPFPHTLDAYPRAMAVNAWNQFQWGQDKALRTWIRDSRLDGFGRLMSGIPADDAERQDVLARLKRWAPAAMANMQRWTGAAQS